MEPDFNIRALEALVISKGVDVVIAEVEAKVAVDQGMVASERVIIEEVAIVEVTACEGVVAKKAAVAEAMAQGTAVERAFDAVSGEVEMVEATLEDRVS